MIQVIEELPQGTKLRREKYLINFTFAGGDTTVNILIMENVITGACNILLSKLRVFLLANPRMHGLEHAMHRPHSHEDDAHAKTQCVHASLYTVPTLRQPFQSPRSHLHL